MTISFLDWIKKLRHPKRISCGGGEITAEEWRSAATLMRRHSSNPPAPAPNSKPEPPAGPPAPLFRSVSASYAEAMEDHKRAVADLRQLQLSKPPFPPDASLQLKVLTISHGMRLRAAAEGAAAAQLREIAKSLVGVVAAEQGSIPPATDFGQAFATAPRLKTQPSGSRRFINGIEQPQPTGSETLLEMVEYAIAEEPWEDEAKGAVLAVARWLRSQGAYTAVALLEREAVE